MPAYAYPAGVRIELVPFSEAALRHFAFLERPEGMDIEDAEGFEAIAQAVALPHDEHDEIVPHLQEFDTIGQLYRSIQAGLEHLAERLGPKRLFVGAGGCTGDGSALPLAGARGRDRCRVGAASHRHDRRAGRGSHGRMARRPFRAPSRGPRRVPRVETGGSRTSSLLARSWRRTSVRSPPVSRCR